MTSKKQDPILYKMWYQMKYRCESPNSPEYATNAEKGIVVLPQWSKDFTAFQKWAFQNDYNSAHVRSATLKRKDLNKSYVPSNCELKLVFDTDYTPVKKRIATINHNDQDIPLKSFCDEYGLKYSTTYARLKRGWTAEEILAEPTHFYTYTRYVPFVYEETDENGDKHKTIRYRIIKKDVTSKTISIAPKGFVPPNVKPAMDENEEVRS